MTASDDDTAGKLAGRGAELHAAFDAAGLAERLVVAEAGENVSI